MIIYQHHFYAFFVINVNLNGNLNIKSNGWKIRVNSEKNQNKQMFLNNHVLTTKTMNTTTTTPTTTTTITPTTTIIPTTTNNNTTH